MTSPLASFHVSNALTYASLLCGLGAVSAALNGSSAGCGACLAFAVLLDTFDGRFARGIRSRSRRADLGVAGAAIGGELDSLVDAVTFGAVPILCASVLFDLEGLLWWAAAFAYLACLVTRLGFYNVTTRDAPNVAPDFVGLPSPVAALFWSSVFLFDTRAGLPVAVALVTAAAMVGPFRIPRPSPAGLAAFVLWPAALLVAHGVRALG